MLGLHKHSVFLRIVSIVTLVAFVPTSVQAWQFMPQLVLAADTEFAEPGAVETTTESVADATLAIPPSAPELPERMLMASAIPLSLKELQSAAAGQTAEGEALLRDARAARDAVDLVTAFGTYLDLVENFPRTADGHSGVYEVIGMLKGADNAHLDEVEASFPPIDTLRTPEGRLVLGNYYQVRGKRAKRSGDAESAARYFGLTKSAARNAMLEFPNDPLQVLAVDAYLSAAEEEGAEALSAAARELETLAASERPNFTSWSSHLMLGNYLPREHKHAEATLHFGSMLDALESEFVQNALKDPGVLVLLKAWIHYGLGMAYLNMRNYEQAMLHYGQVMTLFPLEKEEVYRLAAFGRAYLTYARDPNAVPEAIELMEGILRLEGSLFNDRVLLEIASLYAHQGDYATAEAKLQQFLQEYPDSEVLGKAKQSLDFLQRHLLYAAQVVGRTTESVENPLSLAQACGPIALQKLLASRGISSRLGELMVLAGTDDSGTTMHGLINAAEAKGVTLSGVDAGNSRDLPTPFIAFVDENHFVLVSDVQPDGFVIEDSTTGPEKVSKDAFVERWKGFALVVGVAGDQELLQLSALKGSKGGWLHGIPDDYELKCDKCRNCKLVPKGNSSGSDAPNATSNVAGAAMSPGATTAISRPGINPTINTFRTSLALDETDLQIPVRGDLVLAFSRSYSNPNGFHRTTFQGTTKPWKNIIGDGWTHSYNVFLKTTAGTTPLQVAFFDESGAHRYYVYANSDATYDYYYRSGTGSEGEMGNVLKRVKANGTFRLVLPNQITYHFSAQTTDSEHYARLEKISDESGNEITLTYNGAVGVGKLTKVAGPSGDVQHLAFTYTGNLITKVELKENTTVLQTYQYAYTGNELTTVTDNDGWTVGYTYGSDSGTSGSRYIASITDKRNYTSYFTWTYSSGEAYAIVVEAPNGLETTYERDLSTDKCVITNSDGTTDLTKFVNHPVPGDLGKSSRKDFYLDIANNLYESWLYEYMVESGTNYDVETVKTPQNSLGQHVVASITKYDSKGRVVSERVGASGPVTTYTYTGDNPSPATMTDPGGIVTTYTYDTAGRLTKQEHPAYGTGNSYDYTYDSYGHLDTETNPMGDVIDYGYDSFGRVTSIAVDPSGLNLTTSMVYDDFGNVIETTDPRNNTTYYEYDAGGCGSCGGGTGRLVETTDPLSNVTQFQYDANGNMTKTIDALARETDYTYDSMNQLTTITSPSGSATTMIMTYNVLGLLESQSDFEGKTTEYVYDYLGRDIEELDGTQTPAEPVVTNTFNYFGGLATVTDGLNHTTSYTYNDKFQLTTTTDAINKKTHYTYDTAGRVTKAAAGSSGTVDPTEYFFGSTTGLLSTVRYTSGANSYDADYTYDAAARLTQIDDWLGGNGLRYDYDAAGRMVELTDYDDSTLTYAYDGAGNVTSMTDYHSNTVTYTYDAANRLYTMTAPGSKVWTYTYNALGQPTRVDIPNGMHTAYSYDTRNRLAAIDHMDETTTKQSFDYTLDDDGNISRITHEDGSYWDYGYDGRNRLISADRMSASTNIVAEYDYTYDDADNMLTKVEPFEEDFEDGNYTGWTVLNGTWSASSKALIKTDNGWGNVAVLSDDADNEIRFDYRFTDISGSDMGQVVPRYLSGNDNLAILIAPGAIILYSTVSGTATTLDYQTFSTTEDQWYTLRVESDGANVKVWRSTEGELETEVLTSSSAAPTTTDAVLMGIVNTTMSNSPFELDNIRILADDLENSTTFVYNNANELTSMAGPNGTTAFTYDDWGRQSTQTLNSVTDTYAYRYGSKLYSVDLATDSNIDVTFDYGGDQKRRSATAGGVTTGYNWDIGWNVINEENGSGTMARTYYHNPQLPKRATMAHVDGSSPSSGTYNFYAHDHLGSTRGLFNATRALVASYSYTPYGENFRSHGVTSATHRYTGHDWNSNSGLYFAPHRFYDPAVARWISQDPLGFVDGPNVYSYVRGMTTVTTDPSGLVILYDPAQPSKPVYTGPAWGKPYRGLTTCRTEYDIRRSYCHSHYCLPGDQARCLMRAYRKYIGCVSWRLGLDDYDEFLSRGGYTTKFGCHTGQPGSNMDLVILWLASAILFTFSYRRKKVRTRGMMHRSHL